MQHETSDSPFCVEDNLVFLEQIIRDTFDGPYAHIVVALEISIQCTNLVDPLVCGAIQFGYLDDDIETKSQKPSNNYF